MLDFWRRCAELVVELKGTQDFVSHADRAVESMIREEIAKAFPGDAFLGEETAGTIEGTPERVRIVDPIDGTHNFLRGIPYWNVSIAYGERGARTLGAICDPVAGAVYHGRRGQGAWRSDASGETRLRAANATALPGCLICVGHSDRFPDPRYLAFRGARMDHEVAFLQAAISRATNPESYDSPARFSNGELNVDLPTLNMTST